MKIKEFTWQHRNDFHAIMECEHCGHTAVLQNGYHDSFFHGRVIPAMHCKDCGKNSVGGEVHQDVDVSPITL